MSTIGQRILESLTEVKSWINGHGTMRITLPNGVARDMTNDEYAEWMKAYANERRGSCSNSSSQS